MEQQSIHLHVQESKPAIKSQLTQPTGSSAKLASASQEAMKKTGRAKKNGPPANETAKTVLSQQDIKYVKTLIGKNTKISQYLASFF